jgi:DNA-binding CsgD family transcriptional regulator
MDHVTVDYHPGAQPTSPHPPITRSTPLIDRTKDAGVVRAYVHGDRPHAGEPRVDYEQVLHVLDDARKMLHVAAMLCTRLSEALGIRELSVDEALELRALDDLAPQLQHMLRPTPLKLRGTHVLKQEYGLTERELEILTLVARGLRNPEIAQQLRLEKCTVEQHLSTLYSKLGIPPRSRVELALLAREHNLV